MNKVILSGHVGNTPELRTTKEGTPVSSFVLAVKRLTREGKEETDWPTIIAWRSKAEFVSKYLVKGRKIIVAASVRTRTYEDKNGKTQKITEFHADEIEFCDKKPQEEGEQSAPIESAERSDTFSVGEDDLPF
ncbi:MAG: single-stranded DNA-binding protein [Oscillospiraceae bacterium]|jgi:single-strand DNA-binding protein|nr:single-stranded DNA-binding protein [Oscillospiraceae bacterium]